MNSSTYRFKSKLFNLLNRKSLLLKEYLVYQGKLIKIIFKWSVQITIYPLYFFVHTKKTSQKRLRRTDYSLSPLYSNTDFYLEKTLKKVRYFLLNLEEYKDFFKEQKRLKNEIYTTNDIAINSIQGLASNLITHKLILVTENNITIDILSENQKNYLHKYINLQLNNYKNNSRYSKVHDLYLITRSFTKQNFILFLMSVFWKLMFWMKNESLAMNLNFFGELSDISLSSEKLLKKIPRSIVKDHNGNTKFSFYFLIGKMVQKWKGYLQKKSYQSLRIQSNQFSLKFLVYTTIYYFLSRILSNKYLRHSLKQKKIKLYETKNNENNYKWSSWNETSSKFISLEKYPSRPYSSIVLSNNNNSFHNLFYDYELEKHKANYLDINRASQKPISSHLISKIKKDKQEEFIGNITEVGIKSGEYIKHPLVRILELLDIIFYWIEKLMIKIWKIVLRILNYKK